MEPAGRPEDLFELLEQLGKGSYGAVYKARHRPSGTIVAVKVIPLSGEDEEGLEDIRREIAVLQECVHPNVVRYFGSFMGNEYLWIVMEHCGGGSVRDILSASNRPLRKRRSRTSAARRSKASSTSTPSSRCTGTSSAATSYSRRAAGSSSPTSASPRSSRGP